MRIRSLRALVFAAFITIPAIAQSSHKPVVAFVNGTTLTLVTSSGQVTQEIHLKHPVFDFALSSDQKLLATVAPDTTYGGALSLLDLQTHMRTRLTNGRFYFRHLKKGETEVYADPQFSPDGRSLAFAIHTNSPGDGNDVVMASVPIAVLDLPSRKIRVLRSTTSFNEGGPCFANTPMWSPDGRWILFNCEDGAEITDAQGTTLRQLDMGTDEKTLAASVAWIGNNCVLYVQGADAHSYVNYESEEAQLLNLYTSKSQNPASLLAFPKWTTAGLTEASDLAFIRRTESGLYIQTNGKKWMFPGKLWGSQKVPAAHTIGGWEPSSVPAGCR